MHMPSPNEHHQRLARLAGTWQGKEKMYPSQWDPNGSEATATIDARVDLAGFVVVVDYRQLKGEQVVYAGHGVYTIDPQNHDVVLHWFDVMGGQCEQFRGRWDGDVLTTQSNNAMGSMRLRYDLSASGKLISSSELSPDGRQWSRMFDGTYEKQA